MKLQRRTGRAFVLFAWAGFFMWLWLSGELSRYVGPRTDWVIPFGAITLTVVLLGYLIFGFRSSSVRGLLTRRESAALGLILLPIIGVILIPDAQLGSFAVSKKDAGTGNVAVSKSPGAKDPSKIGLIHLQTGEEYPGYAEYAGLTDGIELKLIGFVVRLDDTPDGMFELARFYIACCAADATPSFVAVDPQEIAPADRYPDDTWLDVAGTLENRDGQFVIVASQIVEIPEPDKPYLPFLGL